MALAYVLYADWIDPEVGRPSLIATGGLMLFGVLYCLAMRARRGAAWVVTGPVEEPAQALMP